jgi:hypothetical protein
LPVALRKTKAKTQSEKVEIANKNYIIYIESNKGIELQKIQEKKKNKKGINRNNNIKFIQRIEVVK